MNNLILSIDIIFMSKVNTANLSQHSVSLVLGFRGKKLSKQGRKEVQGKTEVGKSSEVRRHSG